MFTHILIELALTLMFVNVDCKPYLTTFYNFRYDVFYPLAFSGKSFPNPRFANVVKAWLMENPFYSLKEFVHSP